MNRKILSTAVVIMAVALVAPLAAQADRGDRDGHHRSVYREKHVERHSYHPGKAYGHRERNHSNHHYYRPAPSRQHHEHDRDHHRSSSAAPIILGSVIGGVVGHEIGYGDPGHTAVGAVIGTIIGYDIARHRR